MSASSQLGGAFAPAGTRFALNRIGYGAMQLTGPRAWGPPNDRQAAVAVVREAVATYLPHKPKKKISFRDDPSFGSWKAPTGFDSVEYVRKLRAEWDHRG